jgi:hypothetical protein
MKEMQRRGAGRVSKGVEVELLYLVGKGATMLELVSNATKAL